VSQELGDGATQLGWLMSAQAVGGIAGGFLIGQVGKRLAPLRLIAGGGLFGGVFFLGLVNSGSLSLAMVLLAFAGVAIVALFVSMQTIMQQRTEDCYRGRVFGAYGAAAATMTLVGMVFAGLIGGRVGIPATLSVAACLYILAGLVALTLRSAMTSVTPPFAGCLGSTASSD